MSDFFVAFSGAMVGAVAQGVLWGIMALGVYITFKILDFADMTVDGSFAPVFGFRGRPGEFLLAKSRVTRAVVFLCKD